jgi:large subunit ribosomal protein L3
MMGRMGIETVTMQNLKIVKVDVEKNIILVSGSLPGSIGSTVFLRTAVKGLPSEIVSKAGA